MSARSRRPVTQQQVAKAAAISRTAVAVVLNGDPGARIGRATRARVLRVAKQLGYDRSNLRRIHRRGSPRVAVDIVADVRVVTSSGVHAKGRCRVRTLNGSGLLLAEPQLHPASLPLESFVFRVAIADGPLEGFVAECAPVSFAGDGTFGIGVRFLRLPRTHAARLAAFLRVHGNAR